MAQELKLEPSPYYQEAWQAGAISYRQLVMLTFSARMADEGEFLLPSNLEWEVRDALTRAEMYHEFKNQEALKQEWQQAMQLQ